MEKVWLRQVVCHLVVPDWPVLWQLVSAPFLLTAIECRSCGYDVAVWVHSCDKLTHANHVHQHSFHMHMCVVHVLCSQVYGLPLLGQPHQTAWDPQKLWVQLVTSHQNVWQFLLVTWLYPLHWTSSRGAGPCGFPPPACPVLSGCALLHIIVNLDNCIVQQSDEWRPIRPIHKSF